MQRKLVLPIFALGVTLSPIFAGYTQASAAPVGCEIFDAQTGQCFISVPIPGSGGGNSDGGSNGGSTSGGGSGTPVSNGPPVDTGSTTAVPCAALPDYLCAGGAFGPVLGPAQPAKPGAPAPASAPVDPAVLAQLALSQLNLRAIDIGIVPEADADHTGLVGLPVWMWVENPGPTTFGPNSASASGGGISVTATAQVDRIVWDMGDGTTVTCTTSGTPYVDSYGDRSSPDCGHRYERTSVSKPGGVYQVTATSYWTITWAGGGATGTIPLQLSDSAQVRIGELQVIVTN